jgi:hypothetical protein
MLRLIFTFAIATIAITGMSQMTAVRSIASPAHGKSYEDRSSPIYAICRSHPSTAEIDACTDQMDQKIEVCRSGKSPALDACNEVIAAFDKKLAAVDKPMQFALMHAGGTYASLHHYRAQALLAGGSVKAVCEDEKLALRLGITDPEDERLARAVVVGFKCDQ